MVKVKTFKEKLESQIRMMATSLGIEDENGVQETVNMFLERAETTKNDKTFEVVIKTKEAGRNSVLYKPYHIMYDKVVEVEEGNIVVASNGSVFRSEPSPIQLFIEHCGVQRKAAKKRMFDYQNHGDSQMANLENINQLKFKESGNSCYGITALVSSLQYNARVAESITLSGQDQGTRILYAFETSLARNWITTDFSDLLQFITDNDIRNTASNKYTLEEIVNWNKDLDKEFISSEEEIQEILTKYYKKKLSITQTDIIKMTLDSVWEDPRNKYKFGMIGRISEMIRHHKVIRECLINGDHKGISSVNSYPKLLELGTSDYKGNVSKAVRNYPRLATLMSDTDSAVFKLGGFAHYVIDTIKDVDLSELKEEYPVAKEISLRGMFVDAIQAQISTILTDKVLDDLNEHLWFSNNNIQSWKPEYLMSTIAITSRKKNYAYEVVVNEGNPKSSKTYKGFDKAIFSNYSREYVKNFLENIFESTNNKDLYRKTFSILDKSYNEAKKLTQQGDLSVYAPIKWKDKSDWTLWQYVTGAVCNLLFEEKTIHEERVAVLKLLTPKLSVKLSEEERLEKILDFVLERSTQEFVDKISLAVNSNEDFKTWILKDGLKSIGIPYFYNKVPDELIKLVDVEQIATTNAYGRVSMFLEMMGIEIVEKPKGYGIGGVKPDIIDY